MTAMPHQGLIRYACLLTLLGLSACNLYNVPHRPAQPEQVPAGTAADAGPGYDLHFIESDDQGWFWDPGQANSALSTIETATQKGNTLVLLFIHGWHHSAACYDDNVEAFKRVMQTLHSVLEEPSYKKKMDIGSVRIIGLYVGWRGRSLPWLTDYATFWGRKSAAKRVGEGDLQEFMARLQRLYNDRAAKRMAAGDPFFGLVSIGHSFGGAVLLAATSHYFESQLQLANPSSGFLRTGPVDRRPTPAEFPLGGFGDMVILVNPAVEAAAYERINILSRSIKYSSAQTPLLVTFSAENDGPRHGLFKAGRIAGEFFTNAAPVEDDRERAGLREALGVYDARLSGITHHLKPAQTQTLIMSQLDENPDSQCTDQRPDTFEWWRWAPKVADPKAPPPDDTISIDKIAKDELERVDFSKQAIYSELELKPAALVPDKPGVRIVQPWQPFLVVSVDPQVINGHNGIFSEPFMSFLTRYIGLIEAKRILISTPVNKR